MLNPVIDFYLEKRKSQHNFSLQDMWNIRKSIIGDAYFYIAWLFPATESSKWNRGIPVFNQQDIEYFCNNTEIQQKYLKSFDFVMSYFEIYRIGNEVYPTETLKSRSYWLRQIGHESKKISRIIRSLNICGHPDLAKNLQILAIQLGKEKGFIQPETLGIWENLLKF